MLWWMVQNTLSIGLLAVIVWVICRVGRFRPAVQHVLWLVVLIKFLTPSFICWPWSVAELCNRVASPFVPTTDSNSVGPIAPGRSLAAIRFESSLAGDLTASSRGFSTLAQPAAADSVSLDAEPFVTVSVDHTLSPGLPASVPANSPALRLSNLDAESTSAVFHSSDRSNLLDDVLANAGRDTVGVAGVETLPTGWNAMTVCIAKNSQLLSEYCWRGHPTIIWSSVVMAGCWQLRRLVKSHQKVRLARTAPDWLTVRVRRLAAKLSVSAPKTAVVAGIASPLVWCLGRARLLWPESLATDWHLDSQLARPTKDGNGAGNWADRWDGVIAHELAHLRRRDHWVAWLELVATCLWWWNPLFWFVRRRMREAAELACDAWAVWSVPDGERAFAESLVEVTRLVSRTGAPVPALGVSTGARRSFERRLTMILCERVPCKLSWRGLVGAGVLALLAVPGWMAAQEASVNKDPAVLPSQAANSAGVVPTVTSPVAQQPASTGVPAASSAPIGLPVAGANPQAVSTPSGSLPAYGVQGARPGQTAVGDPNGVPAFPHEKRSGQSDAGDPTVDRISRLELQVQSLLSEIRAMRSEQRANASRPSSGYEPGNRVAETQDAGDVIPDNRRAVSPDGKSIAVIADDGTITLLDIATGKELRRLVFNTFRAIDFTPDGKLLIARTTDRKMELELDPFSGKVVRATRLTPGEGATATDSKPANTLPARASMSLAGNAPRMEQMQKSSADTGAPIASGVSTAASQGAGATQLDLIKLATEYSDAVGNAKLAAGRLDLARRDQATGSGSAIDLLTAQVNLETASNKVRLLRAIAESAAEGVRVELEYVHKLVEKGFAPASQEAQGRAKLRILELILNEQEMPKK
jgi:hypothetical protein